MTEIKLCKNCKFYEEYKVIDLPYIHYCNYKDNQSIDIVTGNILNIKTPSELRKNGCGENAIWFEPKKSLWQRIIGVAK